MIKRQLTNTIISNHKNGFIDIIYGPRRIGKTTLVSQILSKLKNLNNSETIKIFNGDYLEDREIFSNTSFIHLKKLLKKQQLW
ncbi:AAA family ATPase [Patescibacteria group bacterium]|nr:AAA family ATPase [Patescibacteria group bacterium]